MSGFEGDVDELYFFFVVDKVCGEHDVGDVEILWQLADVFGHQVCFHQAIGRIGVGHFYPEDHSQEKTHYILHKLP